jgi:hypothetical protein
MEAAGIQALRHEWLVRPALKLEIDARAIVCGWISEVIDRAKQALSVC